MVLYDDKNTEKIIDINYAKLVPVINYFAQKWRSKRSGSIYRAFTVAGDRGRRGNLICTEAQSSFTAYLSGLESSFPKKVHAVTVKSRFYGNQNDEGSRRSKLTATPKQAAECIL